MRFAISQINCTVGDLEGNAGKIVEHLSGARTMGADIVAFPELVVTGYPPEDLLLKDKFVEENLETLKGIAKSVGDIVAVVGFVDRQGACLYNAAAVIYKGAVKGIYRKMRLPNYGVFDERRYFNPGTEPLVFRFGETIFGVTICEDIWHADGPIKSQADAGANVIINISASPYHAGKTKERDATVKARCRENGVAIVYTNLVGGQDELVFDGHGMAVDSSGKIAARAEAFKEGLYFADLDIAAGIQRTKNDMVNITDKVPARQKPALPDRDNAQPDLTTEIYRALLLGVKDYVAKNDFKKVVIGLSGGVDSALVAALACDALGKDNVTGVFMPSRYSSKQSEDDARLVAGNLGIKFLNISIEQVFKLYLMALDPHFAGQTRDTAEENLQARIRGSILMALSNKFGWMVLTTGNKSEMSTGYATLYGDMAGGFAVIKDVYKTMVYKLAKYRNSIGPVIPQSVIAKEPTAELKPNQKDRDTLPPYPALDQILKAYVEEDKDLKAILSMGFEKDIVIRTLNMVDKSEYKRRQSPPGIKITPKAFGRDRRMPITNKYKEY